MIQHMKAKAFSDKVVQRKILDAKTPIECKQLSKDISNFNFKTWAKKAKELCKKELEAKFMQNPRVMQALLETGQKKLVECTYDSLWGNRIPLHQPTCLNQHLWKNQGILGEILQEIQQTHLHLARSLLPSLNPWIHQGSPNFTRITYQQAHLAPNAPTMNTLNHPTPQVKSAPDHTTPCSP